MAVNYDEIVCVFCDCMIPPLGGNMVVVATPGRTARDPGMRWEAYAHPVCLAAHRRGDKTRQVRMIDGKRQNVNGPCLDRPCCGCCE